MPGDDEEFDQFGFFPFDLFQPTELANNGGEEGRRIASIREICMYPPFPWGQWLYGRLLRERLPNVDGDFIECGVGLGGMSVFLGQYAEQFDRKIYSLDSFEGLPAPDPLNDNPYFLENDYRGSQFGPALVERVRQTVADAGYGNRTTVIPGYFDETLQQLPADAKFSFVHIDVDLYVSALQPLEALFPRLASGGMLVVDDFFHHAQGPARAASHYFASIGYRALYHVSYPYSIVIIKDEPVPAGHHRCIDGNHYSLDYLRNDPVFERAIAKSVSRAVSAGHAGPTQNGRRLHALIRSEEPEKSAEIYEYWNALQDYWDAIDRNPETTGQPITI